MFYRCLHILWLKYHSRCCNVDCIYAFLLFRADLNICALKLTATWQVWTAVLWMFCPPDDWKAWILMLTCQSGQWAQHPSAAEELHWQGKSLCILQICPHIGNAGKPLKELLINSMLTKGIELISRFAPTVFRPSSITQFLGRITWATLPCFPFSLPDKTSTWLNYNQVGFNIDDMHCEKIQSLHKLRSKWDLNIS